MASCWLALREGSKNFKSFTGTFSEGGVMPISTRMSGVIFGRNLSSFCEPRQSSWEGKVSAANSPHRNWAVPPSRVDQAPCPSCRVDCWQLSPRPSTTPSFNLPIISDAVGKLHDSAPIRKAEILSASLWRICSQDDLGVRDLRGCVVD